MHLRKEENKDQKNIFFSINDILYITKQITFDENDRARATTPKLESLSEKLKAKKLNGLIKVVKEFNCSESIDQAVIKAHDRCIQMKKQNN